MKIGTTLGRLTIIKRFHKKGKNSNYTKYLCKCSCGLLKSVSHTNLVSGQTKSCGCLKKEVISELKRKPKGHTCITNVFNYYKRNALNRKLSWKLSRSKFIELILKPCHYCKIIGFTHSKSYYGDELFHNGIDRVDNSKGYTVKNSRTCCKICNRAKNNMESKDFKKWIKRLRSGR